MLSRTLHLIRLCKQRFHSLSLSLVSVFKRNLYRSVLGGRRRGRVDYDFFFQITLRNVRFYLSHPVFFFYIILCINLPASLNFVCYTWNFCHIKYFFGTSISRVPPTCSVSCGMSELFLIKSLSFFCYCSTTLTLNLARVMKMLVPQEAFHVIYIYRLNRYCKYVS